VFLASSLAISPALPPLHADEELSRVWERMQEIDAWGAEARAGRILAGLQFSPEMQNKVARARVRCIPGAAER
jgi:ATPase subunit of ABC transporter with duplicated ATPase domains